MRRDVHTETLSNGLTLLALPMEGVSSAAMAIAVCAGASHDPPGQEGSGSVLSEWLMRGAGTRDSRELQEALDSLGAQHHESVRSEHLLFTSVQLGRHLEKVLKVYADILRRPRLDEEAFEPCRTLTLQDVAALEDEPDRKCMTMLRERFYPSPLGRCAYGNAQSLAGLNAEQLRTHAERCLQPGMAVLAVAGNVEFSRLRDAAGELLGDWPEGDMSEVQIAPAEGGVTHVTRDTAQTHLAMAYPTVPVSHEQYYAARLAETVLSGGMSGRLFTEVREKRGLAYHVSAQYHSLKDHAGVFTYAGTRPEAAQETFEVIVGELRRVADELADEEVERAKVQSKSALVMQGESSSSRAASMVSDWFHLKRIRTLEEISDAIDSLTRDDVVEHLRSCPARGFTMLTIGPEPIDTSCLGEGQVI